MSYLGNAPARSFISFERQVFTIVNSQTAYALSHSVTNENDIRLVVNNVVQEPGSGKAYTATGTALTLSAALTNGTDEMYCVFLGRATATSAPGAGSIGTAQLASDSVTLAKMASGTDGNIISYDASGNPVAVATGNDGQVLTSAGAGAVPTFAALPAGGLEVANSWYVSSDTSASSNTETKITAFASQSTGTGTVFSNSSGTFTAPSTGIYLAIASFACYASGSKFFPYIVSRIKKGGAVRASSQNAIYSEGSGNRWCQLVTAAILDITNTGNDTVTFHFQPAGNNANVENGNTSQVYFIKLADT